MKSAQVDENSNKKVFARVFGTRLALLILSTLLSIIIFFLGLTFAFRGMPDPKDQILMSAKDVLSEDSTTGRNGEKGQGAQTVGGSNQTTGNSGAQNGQIVWPTDPVFSSVTLTNGSNQIKNGTGKTISLPDNSGTIVLEGATAELTNKTIDGSKNTITNLSNSSLSNSKIKINTSGLLSGGKEVALGESIDLKVELSGVSTSSASCVITENGLVTGVGTCSNGGGTVINTYNTYTAIPSEISVAKINQIVLATSSGSISLNDFDLVLDGNVSLNQNLRTTDAPSFTGLSLTNLSSDTATATALVLNGDTNTVGYRTLGTNAFSSATYLTTAVTSLTGTANQITASGSIGDVTLSIPSDFRAPGTVNAVNGLYTGVGAGTQRIDGSGNLVNIGNLTANGNVTVSGTINGATILGGTLTGGNVSGGTLTATAVNGVAMADILTNTTNFGGDLSGNYNSLSLNTVNSNVGSFGSGSSVSTFTVNGKGLITAASNTPIAINGNQITSGVLNTNRGGTGLDTSASTGVPYISSGVWSVDPSYLSVSHGGTGVGNLTANGVLFGNGTGNVQTVINNTGNLLCLTQQSGGPPSWQSCSSGSLSGNGTSNYLTKWTSGSTLGNANIYDSGTNIGIGPGATNPGKPLEVRGGVAIAQSGIGGAIDIEPIAGGVQFWTNPAYNSVNGTSGWSSAMAIVGGNVGIGTNTAPTAKLHVWGDSTTGEVARFIGSDRTWAIVQGGSEGSSGGFGFRDLWRNVTAFNINIDGNVGIGTVSPVSQMHVYSTGGGFNGLTVQNTNSNGNAFMRVSGAASRGVNMYLNGGGTDILTIGVASDYPYSSFINSTGFGSKFYTNASSTPSIVLESNSTNVGIGTTTAVSLLDVNNKFNVLSGGNVGIGSTAPTGLLNVSGAATGKSLTIFNQTGDQAIFTASTSGNTKFVIANDGNVGVGSSLPGFKLDLLDVKTATGVAQIVNNSSSANASGMIVKIGFSGSGVSSNHFLEFQNGQGNVLGSIQPNGSGGVTFATSGIADFAEWMKVSPQFTVDRSQMEPGTIVCQGKDGVVPCEASESAKILGVVSAHPAFLGGKKTVNSVMVGLLGQISVKVSDPQTKIQAGDFVAVDKNSQGSAVLATERGMVVGKALEDHAGSGEVLVLVQPQYFDGQSLDLATRKSVDEIQKQVDILTGNFSDMSNWTNADLATVSGELKVLGRTQLAETTIGGSLSVGTIHLDDVLADVSAMNGSLSLQNGKVKIGSTGLVEVDGILKADEIQTTKITVLGAKDNSGLDNSKASIGQAEIPAGEVKILVHTESIGINSKIFVTSLDLPVALSAQKTGDQEFEIKMREKESSPVKVNWWIVEATD